MATNATSSGDKPKRITSIDAYRGLVMLLMAAGILGLPRVAKQFPDSKLWQQIAFHTEHVEWAGGSLHDMIQPSFSFLVGVAVPFSMAARSGRGQSFALMTLHALWRSLILIALGIFLRSNGKSQTFFTFTDTLSQIGLGYFFLFLLGYASKKVQWIALVLILVGVFLAFVLTPIPAYDQTQMGVPENYEHNTTGLAAHWNKNANLAWQVDRWFLNLFPRDKPFVYEGGGYATLSFIPTLATMLLGLIAGGWLKEQTSRPRLALHLLVAGMAGVALGMALDYFKICPNVKRVWTPAWVLFSGGICFLMLLIFTALFDQSPLERLAFPLVVIGANSIAIYIMTWLLPGWILQTVNTHLKWPQEKWHFDFKQLLGKEYETMVPGLAVLTIYWLILFWMYRRRIFIKV